MRSVVLVLSLAAAAAAEDDPVSFAVGGRVEDVDGQPVAGLAVRVWDALAAQRFLGQGATGPKGRFLVALREGQLARRDHPWGPLRLVVAGPGVADRRVEVAPGSRDLVVRVQPAVPRRIRVVDHEGRPLPALVVRGRVGDGGWWEETTTTEDGSFELRRLPAGPLTLQVVGDGFAFEREWTDGDVSVPGRTPVRGLVTGPKGPVEFAEVVTRTSLGARVAAVTDAKGRFEVPAIGGRLDAVVRAEGYVLAPLPEDGHVELRPAPALEGRVVAGEERPVAACAVALRHDLLGEQTAWTDDRGRFSFAAVPPGMATLVVEQAGFVPVRTRVEADRSADVVLSLSRGATVAARVVRNGRAVAAARVQVGSRRAWTDAKGRALLRGVAPGQREAFAARDGMRSRVRTVPAREGEPVALALELREALDLRGTLLADTGAPLEGVAVVCTRDGAERRALTDPRGAFAFPDLPVGAWRLRAAPEGHHAVERRVEPGRAVRLVARSRLGRARLRVTTSIAQGRRGDIAVMIRRREAPHVRREAAGAVAEFVTLPAGAYELTVRAEGHLEHHRIVEVEDGDAFTKVRVEPERGGTLRLVATPGATVVVQRLRGRVPPLRSLRLPKGEQELSGFGPGRYRFLARAPGELLAVKAVDVGPRTPPTTVELKGGKEASLAVNVENAVGEPVSDAALRLVGPTGFRMPGGMTDTDGEARVTRLMRGRVEVFAEIGNRTGAAVVEVRPGAQLELTIVVK